MGVVWRWAFCILFITLKGKMFAKAGFDSTVAPQSTKPRVEGTKA